jgi:CheY-like chemotaxis protein
MEEKDLKDAVILVVDDNPTNLDVLSEYLIGSGFTLLLKRDGEKALELVKRRKPDLILLDIVMPGIDGFETCRRLKAQEDSKEIPVIFMSALSDTVDKVKGFKAGAVDYITKPFQHEEVLSRVRIHLTIRNLKKDLESKNKELKDLLERERKLAEDMRLNLSISLPHELRTPLNIILGFSGLLINSSSLPEPEKIAEYGNAIYKSGLRLHRLAENALLYANLKLLKYAAGDKKIWQSDSFAQAERFILSAARKKAEEFSRKDDLVTEVINAAVRISPRNFEKILSELLDNAFKFSQPGTPVRVKTTINGSLYIISISDEGYGMTKEQIANIGAYVQFERQQREQQGNGLGLIISHLLTRLEGGMLSVDSKPGTGTTVTLVLGLAQDADLPEKDDGCWFDMKESGSDMKISGYKLLNSGSDEKRTFKIMAVDEYEKNRSMLKTLFSPLGFEILEASDNSDGAELALKHKPDLIFTDFLLLEAENFEMVRRIQRSSGFSHGKVIAVLPHAADSISQERMILCDDTLSKPVKISEIFDKVEIHLGLEWIYQYEKEKTAFSVPPQSELRKLYDLALQGYIIKIFDVLDEIEESDEQYKPFVTKLRQFAKSFQMRLVRNFIEKYLESEK